MRKSNRVLFKTKVYGFNPWADQMPAIKQIMEETGQESEAPVLRMLVDEALRARRRKKAGTESADPQQPGQEVSDCLQTIQILLLKMVGHGQTAFRVQSLSLELLQEILAEAHAGRLDLSTAHTLDGMKALKLSNQFNEHTEAGKDFAYGLANEIKEQLSAVENENAISCLNEEE